MAERQIRIEVLEQFAEFPGVWERDDSYQVWVEDRNHYHASQSTTVRPPGTGLAVLSDDDVRDIRRRYPTESQLVLANEYGVSRSTIGNVLNRKTYAHVE